jgi:holin-like protein
MPHLNGQNPRMRAFFLILCAQGIGALAVRFAHVPLPDAVIGLLLFFVYLVGRKGPGDAIEGTSNLLLRYLPLFFVPASVGVMQYGALLDKYWLSLTVTLSVSVVATMVVTIGVARLAGAHQ